MSLILYFLIYRYDITFTTPHYFMTFFIQVYLKGRSQDDNSNQFLAQKHVRCLRVTVILEEFFMLVCSKTSSVCLIAVSGEKCPYTPPQVLLNHYLRCGYGDSIAVVHLLFNTLPLWSVEFYFSQLFLGLAILGISRFLDEQSKTSEYM